MNSTETKTNQENAAVVTAGTILVASNRIAADPDFGRSVILIMSATDLGVMGFNIAGKLLDENIGIHDGGPMSFAPEPVILADHEKLMQSYEIGTTGHGAIVVDTLLATTLQAAIDSPTMLVKGYAGWDSDQLRQEILEYQVWGKTSVSLTELLAAPVNERYSLASSRLESWEPAAENNQQ
jgi:putative AlgH/UPF0301 family transcriptional regulator